MRRYRADAPRVGHTFATGGDGWQVVDERLERDGDGPYLELVAERDYGAPDGPMIHELEHVEVLREELPEAAQETLARADEQGLLVELTALEPGESPDWVEARAYIDALGLEEIEDDLFEQCGVNTRSDPQDRWLDIVKERLRDDLEAFQRDVDGDHDEIEEWDFRDGRIFATVGTFEDESNPNSGHGWHCRLLDASALRAAGLTRIRKASLLP
jgi:hypothetical protein